MQRNESLGIRLYFQSGNLNPSTAYYPCTKRDGPRCQRGLAKIQICTVQRSETRHCLPIYPTLDDIPVSSPPSFHDHNLSQQQAPDRPSYLKGRCVAPALPSSFSDTQLPVLFDFSSLSFCGPCFHSDTAKLLLICRYSADPFRYKKVTKRKLSACVWFIRLGLPLCALNNAASMAYNTAVEGFRDVEYPMMQGKLDHDLLPLLHTRGPGGNAAQARSISTTAVLLSTPSL